MAVMIVLIFVGTRSWLVTGIILLCNVPVNTAGGFLLIWLWGAEMTTAVVVGILVLLGVMFLAAAWLTAAAMAPPFHAAAAERPAVIHVRDMDATE